MKTLRIYGFDDRELRVFIEDLTEKMADDTLIDDLNEEAERQREEHKAITEEVAGGRTRIIDILGFKDIPTSCAIAVGDLLAHGRETGLMGEAFYCPYERRRFPKRWPSMSKGTSSTSPSHASQ